MAEKMNLKWKIILLVLVLTNLVCALLLVYHLHFHRCETTGKPMPQLRPAITDRTGNGLVYSRYSRTRDGVRYREAGISPETAAALIGYTTHAPYDDHGISGIEKIIDREQLGNEVRTTLDAKILSSLETMVDRIYRQADDLKYVHAVIINSGGELVAASQRPVMGIQEWRSGSPVETVFFPATYLVPVSDRMMELLGCPADALPEAKEKFQFHVKQGFEGEARGFVLGLNRKADAEKNPVKQAATSINYLLAYAAAREKTAVKPLQFMTWRKLPEIRLNGPIEWKLIQTAENGAAVNAIGEIAAENTTLYVFLRAAWAEHDAPLNPAEMKNLEEKCRNLKTELNVK